MPENIKESLESFIASALRSRLQQSTRSVTELRQAFDSAMEKLESSIKTAGEGTVSIPDEMLPAPAEAGDGGALLTHLHEAQQEMLAATDQVGLLTQLLLSCTVSCSRVAFFIVRKEALMGWAARGFEGARDSDVRSLSIGFDEDTILGAAYRAGAPVISTPEQYSGDMAVLSKLGGGMPAESMAVPIFLRDKIAAVLYGDSGREPTITDPELPQILALHAGLCLETLATRQKFPRPKTTTVTSRSGATSRPAAAPRAAETAASPDPTSLSGVLKRPSGLTPPGGIPQVAPPAPPPEPEASGIPEAVEEAPVEAAPAVAEAPPPPSDLSEEERKLHEDARRFARLLVSEMILYNEKQVEEGRRHKDIYERLKDDIDRSRQMYDQRISPEVREKTNYFYDEMVRTLANGDQSALNVPWA